MIFLKIISLQKILSHSLKFQVFEMALIVYRIRLSFFYWNWIAFRHQISWPSPAPKHGLRYFLYSQLFVFSTKFPTVIKWDWTNSVGEGWGNTIRTFQIVLESVVGRMIVYDEQRQDQMMINIQSISKLVNNQAVQGLVQI